MKYTDVTVVGCGPAGMTAALYLLRSNKRVAIFDGQGIGGQVAKAPRIENYPGFTGEGSALAETIYKQVEEYEHDFFMEDVENIECIGDTYLIKGEYGTTIESGNVIVATGGSPIKLNVKGADLDNVHYCATCDGPLYKNKKTVVIGDANSALQYADELSQICEKVTLCAITNKLFGEPVWIQRILDNPKIEVLYNFDTIEITPQGILSKNGEFVEAEGVFIAIGYKPNTPKFTSINCPLDYRGYVMTDNHLSTQKGLYFAGDVVVNTYRQILTAAQNGMEAALNILKGGD